MEYGEKLCPIPRKFLWLFYIKVVSFYAFPVIFIETVTANDMF